MPTLLSNRQETFCRHYAVSGNAAAAARAAGYSEKCARQQGYENLLKPYILIRLDEIRRGFAETAGREAAILLNRLEQVWPIAAADGNTHAMLMTIGMQAKLSGLLGNPDTKIRLWGPDGQAGPLERAVEHAGDGAALAAAEAAAPRDPSLAHRRMASPAQIFYDEPEPEGVDDDSDLLWPDDGTDEAFGGDPGGDGPFGDGSFGDGSYEDRPIGDAPVGDAPFEAGLFAAGPVEDRQNEGGTVEGGPFEDGPFEDGVSGDAAGEDSPIGAAAIPEADAGGTERPAVTGRLNALESSHEREPSDPGVAPAAPQTPPPPAPQPGLRNPGAEPAVGPGARRPAPVSRAQRGECRQPDKT